MQCHIQIISVKANRKWFGANLGYAIELKSSPQKMLAHETQHEYGSNSPRYSL